MKRAAVALVLALVALAAVAQGEAPGLVQEGVRLMQRGQVPDAEALFRRAAALAPGDALALSWHGRALLALRQNRAAADTLQRALDLDDAKPALVRSLRRETLDALGLAYALQEDFVKARGVYARALSYDPEYPVFRYNLACVCALDGDRAGALQALGEYVRLARNTPVRGEPIDPNIDEDFKGLWGDPAFEAVLRVKQGPQPNDTAASVQVRAAGGALAQGRNAEALAGSQKAVELAPDDPRAWYLLGGAQEATGDVAGAAKSYEKALETCVPPKNLLSRPMVRWAALAAGRGRLAAGDAAGAVPFLARAREEDAFRPWPYYELARAKAALGESAEALEFLQKALGLSGAVTPLEKRLPEPAEDPAFKAFAKDPAWADIFGEPEAPAEGAPAGGETPKL